jgi:hypothetical protein
MLEMMRKEKRDRRVKVKAEAKEKGGVRTRRKQVSQRWR